MEIIKYPGREEWSSLIKRPALDVTTLFDTVRTVLDEVREQGDIAVKAYEEKFDKVLLSSLQVSEEEMREADALVAEDLKQAIRTAKANIEKFHASQRFEGKKVETTPGVTCWQKAVAIEKVGLYIPGGTAPLFSTVLMLAVPARIAGCKEIVLCTPPNREGKVHPAILFAAEVAGVSKIFKAGGIQAIAAMAYGTESVPKVYKIFGPGNQYVTAAKQLVSLKEVAIDMPAGPSEVFYGYKPEDRNVLNPFMDETVKEYSLIDGAFIIDSSGVLEAAGALIHTPDFKLQLPGGLGARHAAAYSISLMADCISIVVSSSTGQITLFRKGQMLPITEKRK